MATQLTDAEKESLREVARRDLLKRTIPAQHERKLIELGLIEQNSAA
jgi:hypothetical protein